MRFMASWFIFFFVPGFAITILLSITIHGQQLASTEGFISIDCGIAGGTNYTDAKTGLVYVSDDQFVDAGINHYASSSYVSDGRRKGPGGIIYDSSSSIDDKQLLTLRSFPDAPRSCYALRPVTANKKYIVRATFLYADYDGKNSSNITFDLHIDVNYWDTLRITDPRDINWYEVIAVALGNSISVCLINIGAGTPFISTLELRPIDDGMYPAVNTTQYLDYAFRFNVGPDFDTPAIRYPDDPYDRIWFPYTDPRWAEISTTKRLVGRQDVSFQPPTAVMQTAGAPVNSSVMEFNWTFAEAEVPNNELYVDMFFAELEFTNATTFDVYLNGQFFFRAPQKYLTVSSLYMSQPLKPSSEYRWALNSTGLSVHPPFLNAGEAFAAMHLTQAATDGGDVDAINGIKQEYQVKRNWMGDPCVPEQYHWEGLNCSYGTDSIRIVTVNMSSSALTGVISSYFANLTNIKHLDLSHNNLTGPIPDVLGTLSLLQLLDLTGNNLTGTIPDALLKRSQRQWTFRYDGNPYLCTDGTSCKSKKTGTGFILILCLVPALLVIFLVVIFIVWRARKSRGLTNSTHGNSAIDCFPKLVVVQQNNLLQLENRQFTYKELEKITRKFTNVLGKGGFGTVFLGHLEDGTQVAVKMRSQSSSQGIKEFIAEAQSLTKIHHKNLVSLVGYCMDKDHLALVYEFMSRGTLQDHLKDNSGNATTLSWGQRLQIAVDAAEGLEYLHKGCKPPLIHRDVKSTNILLSENSEAKIADFGLSRAFNDPKRTHTSTAVVGTPGYLDPEYYSSFQLSEKSDVYSFGVVLLELITGRAAIFPTGKQTASLVLWVRQRLASWDIEDIVDARLQRQYDVNSIWKATDVALRCTEQTPHRRPTMTAAASELKESLALEMGYLKAEFPPTGNGDSFTGTAAEVNQTTASSSSSAFEVERVPSFSPSVR